MWLFLAGGCALDDNSKKDLLFVEIIDPSLSPSRILLSSSGGTGLRRCRASISLQYTTQGASLMYCCLCAEPAMTLLLSACNAQFPKCEADYDGWGLSTGSRHFPGSATHQTEILDGVD